MFAGVRTLERDRRFIEPEDCAASRTKRQILP
jgi:hypothetical protein